MSGRMGLARRKVKKIGWGPGSYFQDEREVQLQEAHQRLQLD
jgi:hypothetical protein